MEAEPEMHIDDLQPAVPVAEAKSLPCSAPEGEDHRLNQSLSKGRGLLGWALMVLIAFGGVLTVVWSVLLVYALVQAVIWPFT
jgi:hypothetical protein